MRLGNEITVPSINADGDVSEKDDDDGKSQPGFEPKFDCLQNSISFRYFLFRVSHSWPI